MTSEDITGRHLFLEFNKHSFGWNDNWLSERNIDTVPLLFWVVCFDGCFSLVVKNAFNSRYAILVSSFGKTSLWRSNGQSVPFRKKYLPLVFTDFLCSTLQTLKVQSMRYEYTSTLTIKGLLSLPFHAGYGGHLLSCLVWEIIMSDWKNIQPCSCFVQALSLTKTRCRDNIKTSIILTRFFEGDSLHVYMSGILVVFIIGAGGPLLPHGGKLIVGLMIKYCTNLNFAEYFSELCMPACFQKPKWMFCIIRNWAWKTVFGKHTYIFITYLQILDHSKTLQQSPVWP